MFYADDEGLSGKSWIGEPIGVGDECRFHFGLSAGVENRLPAIQDGHVRQAEVMRQLRIPAGTCGLHVAAATVSVAVTRAGTVPVFAAVVLVKPSSRMAVLDHIGAE